MGTRSGDIDPGAVLYMAERAEGGAPAVERALNRESGLLGLSGISNDVRELLAREANGNARARLALDVFCYRLAGAIAQMTIALPRLDALVFTGGIGENASLLRRRTVERLRPLGLELDPKANETAEKSRAFRIDTGRGPRILVIATDEEWMIARVTANLMAERAGSRAKSPLD